MQETILLVPIQVRSAAKIGSRVQFDPTFGDFVDFAYTLVFIIEVQGSGKTVSFALLGHPVDKETAGLCNNTESVEGH